MLKIGVSTVKSCSKIRGPWPIRLPSSPTVQEPRCGYLFSNRIGCEHKFSWERVREARMTNTQYPNLIRKRYSHMVLWIVGLEGGLKDHLPCIVVAWIHTSGHAHLHASLMHANMHTILTICKTSHLAQMDQARLTKYVKLRT